MSTNQSTIYSTNRPTTTNADFATDWAPNITAIRAAILSAVCYTYSSTIRLSYDSTYKSAKFTA